MNCPFCKSKMFWSYFSFCCESCGCQVYPPEGELEQKCPVCGKTHEVQTVSTGLINIMICPKMEKNGWMLFASER